MYGGEVPPYERFFLRIKVTLNLDNFRRWRPKAGRTTGSSLDSHIGALASEPDDLCTQQHDIASTTRELVRHCLSPVAH
jgi:hypothetical protein